MRATTVERELRLLHFAKSAAAWFEANPWGWTWAAFGEGWDNCDENADFQYGNLTPGSLLALRWGLDRNCVLVVKLDDAHTPILYQYAMKIPIEPYPPVPPAPIPPLRDTPIPNSLVVRLLEMSNDVQVCAATPVTQIAALLTDAAQVIQQMMAESAEKEGDRE